MRHGLLLVRLPPPARPVVEERLARLERLWAPARWATRFSPSGSTLLASWDLDGEAPRWSWGEALPEELTTPQAILDADDAALRALAGSHTLFAVDGDRARVVVGAGGPLAAYTAAAGGLAVWGTHASAVALVAHGRVDVDPAQLPVLLALGASLGADTHVAGVRALELATVVDLPGGTGAMGGGKAGVGARTDGGRRTDAAGGTHTDGGTDAAGGTHTDGGTDSAGGTHTDGGTDVVGGTHTDGGTKPAGGEAGRSLPAGATEPGAWARSFWPRADRWDLVDHADAESAAHAALLSTVERRVGRTARPALALTAGRDSPVIAAAAHELGLPLTTFTFGEADWPDVTGARAVAAAMGLPHAHYPLGTLPEDAVRPEAVRDALWSDGLAGVGPQGAPALPPKMTAMVTGAGAEVARAYSYQAIARERRRPHPEHLLAALNLPSRLPGAPPEAERAAADRTLAWLTEAAGLARGGWSALDVLYTEQRVARWGTARIPRQTAAAVLVPFADPDLARTALSFPLDDRLALGFLRRTIARAAPDVRVPDMQTQRRGIPAPLRRARRRARERTASAGPVAFAHADRWQARPALAAWVSDDLLADPRVADWLGAGWAQALREGFAGYDARHVERALLVAGLVLWARTLADA